MRPTDDDLRVLARRDPVMGRALRRLPTFPGFPHGSAHESRTYFNSLVRSITYQMLTGRAAETIYRRVAALTPGRAFPRPDEVRGLPEDRLRGCGLSRDKTRAILTLADLAASGRLRLGKLKHLPDEEVIGALTQVRGIGTWTAQMFLIFRLGRLDVMPLNDVGIQEGIRRLDGLSSRPTPREVSERAAPWRPLASVASWALWQTVDGEPSPPSSSRSRAETAPL